ncbi:MAG: peptidase M64 [Bacteroidales bacterium]|nr:peptidase M64 [Candidatus Physcousia equi]
MRRLVGFVVMLLVAATVRAQEFEQYFEDETLRLDYVMGGNAHQAHVYLQQAYRQKGWHGRRSRLAETFLKGNGQITVRDHATQQVIYVWTFSTLFQEWQLEEEARHTDRAFDASYFIPMPKDTVDITVALFDRYQHLTTEMTHTLNPHDILICPLSAHPQALHLPTVPAQQPQAPRIHIAILSEGYTATEQDKYAGDCQRAIQALFEREPFRSLQGYFCFHPVFVPSQESGTSVPHLNAWRTTACYTHFDTFYSERYLTTQSIHHLYDLLAGVPFEHLIVLVNSDHYGGGGIYNQLTLTTSDHSTFKEVLVHEFGHAFGGLADEYAYDDMDSPWYLPDTEPWEPNITTLHDFASKWADMMPAGTPIPTPLDPCVPHYRSIATGDTASWARLNACVSRVGVFEGAGYQSRGCYRPAQECRMKINEVENFCPVCDRAIRRITQFYVAE